MTAVTPNSFCTHPIVGRLWISTLDHKLTPVFSILRQFSQFWQLVSCYFLYVVDVISTRTSTSGLAVRMAHKVRRVLGVNVVNAQGNVVSHGHLIITQFINKINVKM